MIKDTDIRFYTIDKKYINYLKNYAPHMFDNKKPGQNNERAYIGVVLFVNNYKYFAPLSSFKEKHKHMEESMDFIKVKRYAVINLNNMIPIPEGVCTPIDFNKEKNTAYRDLLRSEYRYIKMISDKIRKNAQLLYNHKLKYGDTTKLAKRCNDFRLLEEKYTEYKKVHTSGL